MFFRLRKICQPSFGGIALSLHALFEDKADFFPVQIPSKKPLRLLHRILSSGIIRRISHDEKLLSLLGIYPAESLVLRTALSATQEIFVLNKAQLQC